jgi:hypothetical protein
MWPIKLVAPVAAAVLVAGLFSVRAEAANPLECAQRDLDIVTLLEQHGEAQTLSGSTLYEAFWTMMQARSACTAGQTVVGLALYGDVFAVVVAEHARRP